MYDSCCKFQLFVSCIFEMSKTSFSKMKIMINSKTHSRLTVFYFSTAYIKYVFHLHIHSNIFKSRHLFIPYDTNFMLLIPYSPGIHFSGNIIKTNPVYAFSVCVCFSCILLQCFILNCS